MPNVEGAPNTGEYTDTMAGYLLRITQAFQETGPNTLPLANPTDQVAKSEEQVPHATYDPPIPDSPPARDTAARAEMGSAISNEQKLYEAYPWLSPRAFQAMHRADTLFRTTCERGNALAIDAAVTGRHLEGQPGAMSLYLAISSLIGTERHQILIDTPEIRTDAAKHLIDSLNIFLLNRGRPLRPEITRRHQVDPKELPAHLATSQIPDPPLHLLVLAADILNANDASILPLSRDRIKDELPRPIDLLHADIAKTGDPGYTKEERYKKSQQLFNAAGQQVRGTRAEQVKEIKQSLGRYLARHYNLPIEDNSEMIGFLAECRIAERMAHMRGRPGVYSEIAARVGRALGSVKEPYVKLAMTIHKRIAP